MKNSSIKNYNYKDVKTPPARRCASECSHFRTPQAPDYTLLPQKIHDDKLNGSRVIVLTNKHKQTHPPGHPQTDSTKNSPRGWYVTVIKTVKYYNCAKNKKKTNLVQALFISV